MGPGRHRAADAGDRFHDPSIISAKQAVDFDAAVGVLRFAGCVGPLGPQDDVGRTKLLDLLLRPVADPFSHRDQPDHGRRADKDPQGGQGGTHLLVGESGIVRRHNVEWVCFGSDQW